MPRHAVAALMVSAAVAVGAPAASWPFAAGVAAPASGPTTLRLDPSPGTIFTVEAIPRRRPGVCPPKQPKPLRATYRGRLLIQRAEDGSLRIVNRLSFQHYLRGLAEVPPAWPEEALRAQAIAARSYAIDALRRGGAAAAKRGYDICATDACQVYRGARVELGAFGERWVDAVEDTENQVLTYRGRIVQAFYFSTSDGRTRRSFPGGTPQPYYPSVAGRDEDAPLGRWRARFPFRDLTAILRAAGRWNGGRITRVSQSGDSVTISDGARSASISRADFRIALNTQAQCAYPERYPGEGTQTGGKLPLTVPSPSFTLRTTGSSVVLRGRGWGHGVGMSQWGARALAEDGWSARRILSYYYGPARVTRVEDPGVLRVLAAEGMRIVRVEADGDFSARTDTGSRLAGDRFEVSEAGGALSIGRGSGRTVDPVLTVTPATQRAQGAPGASVSVPFAISSSARVGAEIARAGAREPVASAERVSFESGERAIEVALTTGSGPLEPGTYRLTLVAYDGIDTVRSPAIELTVASPAAARQPPRRPGSNAALVAAAAALVVAGAAGVWLTIRRRRRQMLG